MSDRYPAIAPEDLKPDQKILHDHITTEVNQYFNGIFTTHDAKTGALIGPYTHFLYLPQTVMNGYGTLAKAIAGVPDFPLRCREVAILAIGEHYGALYEMYSHSRVGKKVGLSDTQIQDILEGRQPSDATEQELVSWEVARALVGAGSTAKKGPLSEELWKKAEEAFGKTGAGALIHFSAYYAYTSVVLNGTAVPVPEGEKIWPITP